MDGDTEVRGSSEAAAALVETVCAGCGADVRVRSGSRTVEGPDGRMGAITYADADIVVWDCPACGFANAEALAD